MYEDALRKSGYDDKLEFCPERQQRRRRRRTLIWYNPSYSKNVKTNIGREFLRLLNVHFHREHAFHKIFNKNTVKLSYSCTKNISSIISGHNKMVTKKLTSVQRECNCRDREQCPLDNKCLTDNIVYEAKVTCHPDEVTKDYRGLCSTAFKERLGVHRQHMTHRKHMKKCELAKHVWQLKDANKTFSITWQILRKVHGRLVGGVCRLCTSEKLLIIEHPDKDRLLNSNWVQKCRHAEKYLLSGLKDNRNGIRDGGVDTMD